MNKFINHEGQQPMWLGDIDFMNNSVREAISMVLQGMTGQEKPTCILRGCEASDTGISAGIICLEGEVLPVEATTQSSSAVHLEVSSSLAGERAFKDGSRHSCWEYRKGIWVDGTDTDTDFSKIADVRVLMTRGVQIYGQTTMEVEGSCNFWLRGDKLEVSCKLLTKSPFTGDSYYTVATYYFPNPLPVVNANFPVVVRRALSSGVIQQEIRIGGCSVQAVNPQILEIFVTGGSPASDVVYEEIEFLVTL